MENKDKIIKTCPESERLADYVAGNMSPAEKERFQGHIAGCNACLECLSLSARADSLFKTIRMAPASPACAAKAKAIAAGPAKAGRNIRRHLWLLGAIAAFVLSFVFKGYFMQFLTATILLGVKWIVESENVRTLILVLDSWRRHEHGRDEEISTRLKDRTSIKNLK